MKKIILSLCLLTLFPFKNDAGDLSITIYRDAYESDYQIGTVADNLYGGELIDYTMWVSYESWPRNGHASVRFGNETITATITNPYEYYTNAKRFPKDTDGSYNISYGVYVVDTGAASLTLSW